MIQVGIIGGAGYTAGELIRLLLEHPNTELNFVFSSSKANNKLSAVHQDLIGSTNLKFTDKINKDVDLVFLCLGHGNSKKFLEEHNFSKHTKVIDLSSDFRLKANSSFKGNEFVYGLPELQKKAIQNACHIANPGCFATAIQLALLPLAKAGLLTNHVHVNAVTGATGAGSSLSATTHYTWRANNFSYYKPFEHQHLSEINQTLHWLKTKPQIMFLPNRGGFSRGIYSSLYTTFNGSQDKAQQLYRSYYKEVVFTHISENQLHLKQVLNTNKCLIHLHKHQNLLLITSIIDNLLKGASGQAVQNMNLLFGFDEDAGLKLKAHYF
ncbi:MAG: N-acetyl-gamma-glutamyl-phosphate reductase [Tenacibaculum sp.]